MPQGWKVAVVTLAVAGIVSTPLVWLLNGSGPGQLVGASVQGAVSIAAFAWALLQGRADAPADQALGTAEAVGRDGGTAVSGVKRPQGLGGGSAKVENSGKATAIGKDSRAVSGIDYS